MNKEASSINAEATLVQANLIARRTAANQDPSTRSLRVYIKPTRLRSWSISSSSSVESYPDTSPTSPIMRWLETPGRDEGVLKAMEHVQFGW
jgi:hypothetical protein